MDKYYYEYQNSQPPKRSQGSYSVDPRNQKFTRNDYTQESIREQTKAPVGHTFVQDTSSFSGIEPQYQVNSASLPAITNMTSMPKPTTMSSMTNLPQYPNTSTQDQIYSNSLSAGGIFERGQIPYDYQKELTNSTPMTHQSYSTFDSQSSNSNLQTRSMPWTDNTLPSFSSSEHQNRDVFSTPVTNLAPRSGSYVFDSNTTERSNTVDSILRLPSTTLPALDQRYPSGPSQAFRTGVFVETAPVGRMENLNQYQYVSPFNSIPKQESTSSTIGLNLESIPTAEDPYRNEPSLKQAPVPNSTGNPRSSYLDEIFQRKQSVSSTTDNFYLPIASAPSPSRSSISYQGMLPQHTNSGSPPLLENQPSAVLLHDPLHRRVTSNDSLIIPDLAIRQLQPNNPIIPDPQVHRLDPPKGVPLEHPFLFDRNTHTSPVRNPHSVQHNAFTTGSYDISNMNENLVQPGLVSPSKAIKPTSSGTQFSAKTFPVPNTPAQESVTSAAITPSYPQPSIQNAWSSSTGTEPAQEAASYLKPISGQGVYNLSDPNAGSSWPFPTNTNESTIQPESNRSKSLDIPIVNPSKSGHHNIGPLPTAPASQSIKPSSNITVKQDVHKKARYPTSTRHSNTNISDTSTPATEDQNVSNKSSGPLETTSNVIGEPRVTSIIAVAVDTPKIQNVLGPEYIVAPPPHSIYDRDKLITKGVELWIRYAGEESVSKFSDQLKELIGSQYPSDRKFLLEHIIAVWLTWEPEKFHLILEPLSSMVKKRRRIYNKRASPFYALVQLFSPITERVNSIFDPTAELQADYSIDVKCPNLCQNLLEYLTEENTNDHLVTWIIDCLSVTSPLVQKRYFKWLIEKIDWNNSSAVAENSGETNHMQQLLSLLKDDKSKSTISSALISVFFTSWKNREALFKSQELRPTLVSYFNNPGSIAAQNQLYILLADEPESSRFSIILELLNALKEHSEPGSIKWFYNLILPVMIDVIVEKDQSLAALLFETLVSDEEWFSFLFFKSRDVNIKRGELYSLEDVIEPDTNRGLLSLIQSITQLEQYKIQSRISDMWLQQWKKKKTNRSWILALVTLFPQCPQALQEMTIQLIQCTLTVEYSDDPIWCDIVDMFVLNSIPALSSLFRATFNMFCDAPQIRDQVYTRFEESLAKLSGHFIAEVANKTKTHGKKSKKKKQKWNSAAHTISKPVTEFVELLSNYLAVYDTDTGAQALAKWIIDSSCCISLIKFLSPSPSSQIRLNTVSILDSLTSIAKQDPITIARWVKTWEAQEVRTLTSLLADSDDSMAEKARSLIVQLLSSTVDVSALCDKFKNELHRDCRSTSDKINRFSAQPDQIGALGPLRIILARQQTILRNIQEQASRTSDICTSNISTSV
ncbi:hypothetical protein K7432_011131 [Basidiobolus ranarum]|uniref:Uncharacterized protein n=1 Tax=Basidiobolus ranarum TaxID=34480 RepID=A0ABR2VUC4_9FUNG